MEIKGDEWKAADGKKWFLYSTVYSSPDGTMKRRADEIDIILYGDYVREDDETRYGDIWTKKSYPDKVTKGYENIE